MDALGILDTAVDHRSHTYLAARAATLTALGSLEAALDAARDGGGERAVTRHHARGRLLPRQRIELLVDRDSPLLELCPVAGWGTGGPVGAAVVTAVGVVAGRPCVIVADDPTIPAGAGGTVTGQKVRRAQQIALENRLPLISLVESGEPGPAPPEVSQVLQQAGQVAAGVARLAATGVATIAVCFGEPAGDTGATGGFDHTITLRAPHRNPAGLAWPGDHPAQDERDALRLARECARRFPPAAMVRPAGAAAEPKHDPEDLLAVPATEPREILTRVLDGSEFDEVQPGYGVGLCTGWGEVHGHPVAVLADAAAHRGEPADEADKATRMVRLAARAQTPLLFLQHGTGPAVVGAAALAAAAGAGMPLLCLRVGRWHGPAAVPALARFRFAWPRAEAGLPPGGEAGSALEVSGRLADDGVIDPRDTRTVLGLCLSVVRR